MNKVEEIAHREKPKLIIAGASAYARDWDYARFRAIADSVGAILMADISHPAGLIATKLLNDPMPHCHIVTTTTHKTLRGPRGGMIMIGKDFENPWGQKTIGGYNDAEYVKSIQQTTDGGYILGGSSGSNISGEKTDSCRGYKDYWVIKLTANGTMEWQKTIGGKEYDNFYSIKQTIENGYILGGSSSSNVAAEKTDSCRG